MIHNFAEFGELLSLLYVSDAVDEWEMDRQDLKKHDVGICKKFG